MPRNYERKTDRKYMTTAERIKALREGKIAVTRDSVQAVRTPGKKGTGNQNVKDAGVVLFEGSKDGVPIIKQSLLKAVEVSDETEAAQTPQGPPGPPAPRDLVREALDHAKFLASTGMKASAAILRAADLYGISPRLVANAYADALTVEE